jgi:hypothetical protein
VPDDLLSHWRGGHSIARVGPIADRPWGVREFSFADHDNNQLRFGTILPEPRLPR